MSTAHVNSNPTPVYPIPLGGRPKGAFQSIAIFCLVFVLNVLCVKLSLKCLLIDGPATIWPASGLGVGFLLSLRKKHWLPVLLAVFLSVTGLDILDGLTPAISSVYGLCVAAEALLAAVLVNRYFGKKVNFSVFSNVIGFFLIAVVLSNSLTACLGILANWLQGRTNFFQIWYTWALADGVGMLLVTPLIVALSEVKVRKIRVDQDVLRLAAVLVGLLGLAAYCLFFSDNNALIAVAFPCLMLSCCVYASIQFRLAGAILFNLAFYGFGVILTLRGQGPFVIEGYSVGVHTLMLQVTLITCGLVTYIVAAIMTERDVVLEDLRTQKEFADSLIDAPHDTVFLFDYANGHPLRWNETFRRLSGYTNEEISQMKAPDAFYGKEELGRATKALTELGEDGKALVELSLMTKDGTFIPFEYSAITMNDAKGDVLVLAIGRDLSERKQAEKKMIFHSEIMIHMREAVYLTSLADETIVYSNANFEELFGYESGEMLGMDVSRINAPTENSPEQTKDEIVRVLRKNGVWEGEVKNIKKDGTMFWCFARVSTFEHPEFGMVILAVHSEITERKAAQEKILKFLAEATESRRTLLSVVEDQKRAKEEVHKLNTELEQRVTARTVQLESANKDLEAFSYSVSHDLRAPLRAINGFVRILMDEYSANLDAEAMRVCTIINESALDMGRLIDELLAFSRLGRLSLTPSPVDMETLVHSIYETLTTPEERGRINFDVAPLSTATADPTLMRQLWQNLIGNAVKFSSKNEHATIDVKSQETNGEIVFSVRDNGAGFDMRYIDKLFGVFQRLHSAKEFEGTGVGLAIAQRVVQLHDGRIWAEGQVGKGATFFFTLTKEKHDAKSKCS